MKKTAKETLRLAVEQLFIRIHKHLFVLIDENDCIDYNDGLYLSYDKNNEVHTKIVNLCKTEIGFNPIATDRDIFYSIVKVYVETKKQQLLK